MGFIHVFHQHLEDLGIRIVLVHIDLLTDDALLLLHRFIGKVGGGHKFQQKIQTLGEILCAGEVVGGHIVAGEGIGNGT